MKILISYASRRGTTRQMAEEVSQALTEKGLKVDIIKASNLKLEVIPQYDVIIFGSSTWADGDLHEDFDQLERKMRDLDLSHCSGAVFGSGNSRFRFYCEAVDVLETRLKHCNCTMLIESLKSDVMEKNMIGDASTWGKKLSEILYSKIS